MNKIVIPGSVCGEVEAPGSKSYAQRITAANYLAGGFPLLGKEGCPQGGVADCEDTAAAVRVVEALRSGSEVLDVGESGLSARLFTPIAALENRPVTITGRGSLLRRPMTMMVEPLRALGVEVVTNDGFLPITVRGPLRGGDVEVDGSVSSQFLTGLLMALPLAQADTTLRVADLRSVPYIDMTLEVMRAFGVEVGHRDYEEFYIPGGGRYTPVDFAVEGDWSAASCLLVAGAFSGPVMVRGLRAASLQADVAIPEALSAAGACVEQTADSVTVSRPQNCHPELGRNAGGGERGEGSRLRAFSFDATDCPDLFPALAALAAGCEGISTIVGTDRLTHKESDRAAAIAGEFGRLGIAVDVSQPGVMLVEGGAVEGGVTVDSHNDHRIAMALAVVALRASAPVVIAGAGCVDKSYKNFWRDYESIRAKF